MSSTIAHLPLRIPAWSFADRIRKVRRESGLTLAQMATEIGVGEKAYAAWETGRNTPSQLADVAVRLERATGVPRTWFMGWDDEKAPTVNGGGLTVHPPGFGPGTHWFPHNVTVGFFGEDGQRKHEGGDSATASAYWQEDPMGARRQVRPIVKLHAAQGEVA